MDIPILYEDTQLLVIDKPPGIIVNRADSVHVETVQDWAAPKILPGVTESKTESNADFFDRAGIVHRIDKETSGCLVIAKTPAVFIEMQRLFKERHIHKTYLAIVHGNLVPATGEITAPVGRLPWNRERFGIVPEGKPATTTYGVRKHGVSPDKSEPITLVELTPLTGRTHQIRVHLKYVHHPIVGDWQYAGRKTSRDDRKWAPRVMLHAWKIAFDHPVTGQKLAIESPVPDDMNSIII